MGENRIRGQEAEWIVSRAGIVEDTFADIASVNFEFEGEIKSQGYIGQKTKKKDGIFNGCKGDFMLHSHTSDWLTFMRAVHDKQRRIDPTLIVNLSCVFFYDDEDKTIMFPNVTFGGLPVTLGAREDYIGKKFQWECSDYDIS